MLRPFSATSGSFFGAPSRKRNDSRSSRVNSSGPSAQCSRFESPDQCRYSPASLDTFATGSALLSLLATTVLPPCVSGMRYALKFSRNATHFSSGDTR